MYIFKSSTIKITLNLQQMRLRQLRDHPFKFRGGGRGEVYGPFRSQNICVIFLSGQVVTTLFFSTKTKFFSDIKCFQNIFLLMLETAKFISSNLSIETCFLKKPQPPYPFQVKWTQRFIIYIHIKLHSIIFRFYFYNNFYEIPNWKCDIFVQSTNQPQDIRSNIFIETLMSWFVPIPKRVYHIKHFISHYL